MNDRKASLILHVGERNAAVVDASLAAHPDLRGARISSVNDLSSFLARSPRPELVLLEDDGGSAKGAEPSSFVQKLCDAPILLLVPAGRLEPAMENLFGGVVSCLVEPLSQETLYAAVIDALRVSSVWDGAVASAQLSSLGRLIGSAPCMQALYETIKSVSGTDATVFIQGPSGTGKELVAHAVHDCSLRASKSFIAINCGAIPPTLLESELFGHERGAFTGAVSRSIGKFEQANTGTLFLDEVTELPLDLQVKLLRIIQEMQVVRIGGKDVIPIDVRLICASNRDVAKEVREGRFREDLYYRLNVVPVKTPPLTERRQDIPLLMMHFLNTFSSKYKKYFYEFSPQALRRLCAYDWPGNVREMENMIERIVVLHNGAIVEEKFLPEEVLVKPLLDESSSHARFYPPTPVSSLPRQPHSAALPLSSAPQQNGASRAPILPLWQVELNMIRAALAETRGNVIAASRLLEIGQATLYRKIKQHGIDPDNP